MYLKNKTILIISPEPFGKNLLSKHYYALELARFNRVFFLCFPHGQTESFIHTNISENLIQIGVKNNFVAINILPEFWVRKIFRKKIQSILRFAKIHPDVVISFFPYFFWWLKDFGAQIHIFGLMDYFPNLKKRNFQIIYQNTDLVLTVSKIISDHYGMFNAYFLGHAIPGDLFESLNNKNIINEVPKKVGFMGTLKSPYLDLNLIHDLVNFFPDLDFYFAGSKLTPNNLNYHFWEDLATYPNVHMTGLLTGNHLTEWLSNMDLFIFPYTDKAPLRTSNSLKILFYLATGKPVVASPIATYQSIDPNIMIVNKNSNEFLHAFRHVVSNYKNLVEDDWVCERKNMAQENTYDKKVLQLDELIRQHLDRKK
ncbi:MAG: hypothetical protein KatS3mg034_1109 [Vicingaceae bacterium]|nr:MAG: hypothetical protein KatS3mg034_1109 [Vicingaceae bacterium]